MRSNAFKIETIHWPYGLEIEAVEGGLLLRPRKKARSGWAQAFSKMTRKDDIPEFRLVQNEFDGKEWEW